MRSVISRSLSAFSAPNRFSTPSQSSSIEPFPRFKPRAASSDAQSANRHAVAAFWSSCVNVSFRFLRMSACRTTIAAIKRSSKPAMRMTQNLSVSYTHLFFKEQQR